MPIKRPKPIVEQVDQELRQRIRNRVYPPGGRLPSETELAQTLGVSRATVRTVLAKLAAEGLIVRKQGDGTYVNVRIRDIDARYGGVWDFSRLIASNGFRPKITLLSLEYRSAAPHEARALALPADADVLALVRLFYADEQPVIHTTNIIPAHLLKKAIDPTAGEQPIHLILNTYTQEAITYAISDIEATLPHTDLNTLLHGESDHPLLKLIETFYNKHNQPLVFGLSYYDYAVIRLRLVQAWG
jgi:DNA-binding GntR family transcriptional regulator